MPDEPRDYSRRPEATDLPGGQVTTDVAPIVRMVLREASNRLLLIDAELATHLDELASDYAGPYAEEPAS